VANQNTYTKLPFKVLGDTKPDCAMLPNNNDNEGNTMINNNSGLGQNMERNTPTLNSSHCNPEKRNISTIETKRSDKT
jgi:hypothetical protein